MSFTSPASIPSTRDADRSPHDSEKTAGLKFGHHRLLITLLAVIALVVAWSSMTSLSRKERWYSNTEMNLHNMVDALAINSDVVPGRVDQPGLTSKYLLALDYRIRHYAGLLPVWNLKKFGDQPELLPEIPRLLRIGRTHSQILVMLFILTAAGSVYSITRSLEASLLAMMLLCSSAGLLFHGLVNRPDLLCTWFGTVLAPFFLWRFAGASSTTTRHLWLFMAGLAAGLAVLTKLPGLYYFVACYAWCWLRGNADGIEARGAVRFSSFLLPIASSAALLWVIARLGPAPDGLAPAAVARLRIAASIVGTLPLLGLCSARNRVGNFLLNRGWELAALGAGALAAISVSYGALCGIMTLPRAEEYLAHVVQFVANPDPQMKYLVAPVPRVSWEFFAFVKESPFLFTGSFAVTVVVCITRGVPAVLRGFIVLLFANAICMTWILSHRYFLDQFSVFAQVPLLLLWALALSALGVWRSNFFASAKEHWAAPAVVTSVAVLVASVFLRLEPKDRFHQTEAQPPVSELTRTYLYDHQAHPERYRQIMQQHYETREEFVDALETYLINPAHRH